MRHDSKGRTRLPSVFRERSGGIMEKMPKIISYKEQLSIIMSNLVVEERHHACLEIMDDLTCPICHGTGYTKRGATPSEFREFVEFILNPQENDWIIDKVRFDPQRLFHYFVLSDGGRLRLEK